MGMLVQMTQGEYWLVDSSDSVKIDMSHQPQTSDGLFCEHMVVLVEGKMLDGVFVVTVLILPKMETRAASLKLQPTLSLTLCARIQIFAACDPVTHSLGRYPEQLSSFNLDDLVLRERERINSRIIVLR
jgi:hypothetical protein